MARYYTGESAGMDTGMGAMYGEDTDLMMQPHIDANELGFIRSDAVFSTVESNNVETKKHGMSGKKTIVLKMPNDCLDKNQVGVTCTAVNPETMKDVKIPQGSTIHSVKVVKTAPHDLDPNLELLIGLYNDEVPDKEALKQLIQKFASNQCPLTGALLNSRKTVTFSAELNGAKVQKEMSLYAKTGNGNGDDNDKDDLAEYHLRCITDSTHVGELRDVFLAVTVNNGKVMSGDVLFFVDYTPAPPC